jgi:hypothetical protein
LDGTQVPPRSKFEEPVRLRNYAAEELIAELDAAFLAFFTACSQASKAAEYLRGLALAEPAERAA